MRVELYTKPECSLCETAKGLVTDACQRLHLSWDELSIYDSQESFQRFRYLVPVLCVDGVVVATLDFAPLTVEGLLRAALDKRGAHE